MWNFNAVQKQDQVPLAISADAYSKFLAHVRSGPGFLGLGNSNGALQQVHFENDEQAMTLIDRHSKCEKIWVSMASFSDANAGRSQQNAGTLRSLWLDVDVHENSKYKSIDEARSAIDLFITMAGLPKPTLLHMSGHGLHVFWSFLQSVEREKWYPVAQRLQELANHLKLGADPITADAARFLRVAGTLNYRDPANPVLSQIIHISDDLLEFDRVDEAIKKALTDLPALTSDTAIKQKTNSETRLPDTPEGVATVRAMLDKISPDINYTEWRDVIWAVAATRLECAYDLAYHWSSRGANWDEGAFIRVWNSFDASRGIGFGTLAYHAKKAGYVGALPTKSQAQQLKPTGRLVTVCAADIKPEHVEWLVDQSFPLGMLAVIGGQPGLGKSQISINLAAGVTTGKGLPGTGAFKDLGSVIILANEDDAARTIRPRLDAAGADISKVHIVEGVAREAEDVDMFQLDQDIADLRERALQIGDVKLIIIDPPSAYLGSKVDSYKDSDVRRVLMPLGTLAQDTGAMILLIVHLNKRTDGGAQQRFSGSTAWTAAPRVGFMVAEDPLTKQRFMLPVKNNIGDDRLGYQYHIEEKLIGYGDQTFKSSFIVWDQTTNRSVGELLAPQKASKLSVVDDAKSFLENELASGPVPVEKIISLSKTAGVSWPSVNRAKKDMPIISSKVGDGWVWTLLTAKENGNV